MSDDEKHFEKYYTLLKKVDRILLNQKRLASAIRGLVDVHEHRFEEEYFEDIISDLDIIIDYKEGE